MKQYKELRDGFKNFINEGNTTSKKRINEDTVPFADFVQNIIKKYPKIKYDTQTKKLWYNGTDMTFEQMMEFMNEESGMDSLVAEFSNLTIKGDGRYRYINSNGDFELDKKFVDTNGRIIYKFYNIEGNFVVPESIRLTSLENMPDTVTGNTRLLNCIGLKSLKDLPESDGNLVLYHNESIENLDGFPMNVGGSVYIKNFTKLTSLKGAYAREVGDKFWIENSPNLSDLSDAPNAKSYKFTPDNVQQLFDKMKPRNKEI